MDRRIYRVDRWALPVPGGVPLRGLGYFALALGAMIVLGRVPGVGELLGAVSAPVRYVIVPLAAAVFGDAGGAGWARGASLRGRLAAVAAAAAAALGGPQGAVGGRRVPWTGTVATVWDEHAPELAPGARDGSGAGHVQSAGSARPTAAAG